MSREKSVRDEDYYLNERGFGRFQRTIPLPKPISSEQTRATFRNGVLTVTAPIAEEAKRNYRSVPIES
jgi:HSP20 family protein